MTKAAIIKDINGAVTYQLPFCANKYSVTLTTGLEATVTVPGNSSSTKWLAVFRYEPGATVWFSLNDTAAVPAGATLAATDSCLNFPGTEVKTGDVLHFISADATASVGVELYELQPTS